jgi:hypothetical protein
LSQRDESAAKTGLESSIAKTIRSFWRATQWPGRDENAPPQSVLKLQPKTPDGYRLGTGKPNTELAQPESPPTELVRTALLTRAFSRQQESPANIRPYVTDTLEGGVRPLAAVCEQKLDPAPIRACFITGEIIL